MNIVLFDPPTQWQNLLPLTFNRPISLCRIGILTIKEKWQRYFPEAHFTHFSSPLLEDYYPLQLPDQVDAIYINGGLLPTPQLIETIKNLELEEFVYGPEDQLVVAKTSKMPDLTQESNQNRKAELQIIRYPWQFFLWNEQQIGHDFELLSAGRSSAKIDDPHTVIYGAENLFVEPGVTSRAAIINAESGPVYLGQDVEIGEGSIIQGPFAACEGVTINPGSKIRKANTIGPQCKVGGEVSNSIFFGFSNKGHDGFLGNSVIGEWCNLGADTNTSNLKNNYGNVQIFNYLENDFIDSEQQFCGTIMGDHVKCSINTMLNTGTVIGFGANIFGAGFPPKHVPPFSWGFGEKSVRFDFEKFLIIAERVMERRKVALSDETQQLYQKIFDNY